MAAAVRAATAAANESAVASSKVMPQEMIDQAVGSRVWIVMRNEREFAGTLCGFDEYVNMVLEDVTEYSYTEDGVESGHLDQILLNGNNVCFVIPRERATAEVGRGSSCSSGGGSDGGDAT